MFFSILFLNNKIRQNPSFLMFRQCIVRTRYFLAALLQIFRVLPFTIDFNVFLFLTVFNCPRPTFGHYQGSSLTLPMLIIAFLHIWPECHLEPRSEVASRSPTEQLVGFERGTFRFWLQSLNPQGYSPRVSFLHVLKSSKFNVLQLVFHT